MMEGIMAKMKAGTASPNDILEAAREMHGAKYHLKMAADLIEHLVKALQKENL